MKRVFFRGVVWSATANWSEQIAAVAIFLVISRLIGPSALGVAAMAFAFLLFGEFLVRDTLTEAIVERAELEDGRLEATFFALLGFGLLIAVLLALVAYPLSAAYGDPLVAPLLIASVPTIIFVAAAGVSAALLRRRLAFQKLAIPLYFGVLAGGIVGIALAAGGYGPWSLVGQRLASVGVYSMHLIAIAQWRPRRLPRAADFALLRGLGPQVVLLRGLTLIIVQTPTVALGLFATPVATGLYFFAARLVEIVQTVIVIPVRGVAQASFADERRRGGDIGEQFLDLTEFLTQFSFPTSVGLALVAVPTVTLLMGPNWSGAAAVVPFLAVAAGASALVSMQEAYLMARDRMRPFVLATAAEAALGLVLAAAAGSFGAAAVAAAMVLRVALGLPLRTAAALTPDSIPARRLVAAIAGPAAATLVMAATVWGWMTVTKGMLSGWPYLISAIAAGVASYAAVVFLVMPASGRRLLSFLRA